MDEHGGLGHIVAPWISQNHPAIRMDLSPRLNNQIADLLVGLTEARDVVPNAKPDIALAPAKATGNGIYCCEGLMRGQHLRMMDRSHPLAPGQIRQRPKSPTPRSPAPQPSV